MLKFFLVALFLFLPTINISAQCTKDIECKGDRICVDGECVAPGETVNVSPQPAKSGTKAFYTIDDLTPTERTEYDNKKLSIETRGQGVGGGGGIVVSMETWTRWYAYQGFRKISEEEFFMITGREEQAAQTKAYKSKNIRLWTIGMGTMLVGAGIMGGNLSVGLPVFMVGAILTPIGAFSLAKNKFPYATVANLTDGYNTELIKGIIARRG